MNTQLVHIIRLAMGLADTGELANISIGGNSKTVTVFLDNEQRSAKLDDRNAMNAIIDWLALGDVNSHIKQAAKAKAEKAKAWRADIDKVALDITAPGIIDATDNRYR